MRQFLLQLLETGEAKNKTVKQCQEDARRGYIGIGTGVCHMAGMLAQAEPLVEPSGKRRQ